MNLFSISSISVAIPTTVWINGVIVALEIGVKSEDKLSGSNLNVSAEVLATGDQPPKRFPLRPSPTGHFM